MFVVEISETIEIVMKIKNAFQKKLKYFYKA